MRTRGGGVKALIGQAILRPGAGGTPDRGEVAYDRSMVRKDSADILRL